MTSLEYFVDETARAALGDDGRRAHVSKWGPNFAADVERDRDLPVLPLREKPCGDCAVVHGLYSVFAEALADEPEDVQRAYSEKWFCHETPGSACRGAANLLVTIRRRREGT